MRKTFLSLAIFATALVGSTAAQAGFGVLPFKTTYSSQATDAPLVVRASISEMLITELDGTAINPDHLLYRLNAPEAHNQRRDMRLNISKVIRKNTGVDVEAGSLTVISAQQRQLSQYAQSLQDGEEAIFFLHQRANGLWEVRGEGRGLISEEQAGGNIDYADNVVSDIAALRVGNVDDGAFYAAAQNRMMQEMSRFGSRLATDALIDFGWNYNQYAGHFDAQEKATLLSLLADSEPGSAARKELITAMGRTLPEGGQAELVTILVNDTNPITTAISAWALEQYGRGSSSQKLIDAYVGLTDENQRAAVIRGLGLIRPKSYRASEANARDRFTEILRSTLVVTEAKPVLTEALIAARDLRFLNDEVKDELTQIAQNFRAGVLTDEVIFKRAIVALAAARTEASREFLEGLKGQFRGNYDKHIELALTMPFHTLVDYR